MLQVDISLDKGNAMRYYIEKEILCFIERNYVMSKEKRVTKKEPNHIVSVLNSLAKERGLTYGQLQVLLERAKLVAKYELLCESPEHLNYVEYRKQVECFVPKSNITNDMLTRKYFEAQKFLRHKLS